MFTATEAQVTTLRAWEGSHHPDADAVTGYFAEASTLGFGVAVWPTALEVEGVGTFRQAKAIYHPVEQDLIAVDYRLDGSDLLLTVAND